MLVDFEARRAYVWSRPRAVKVEQMIRALAGAGFPDSGAVAEHAREG